MLKNSRLFDDDERLNQIKGQIKTLSKRIKVVLLQLTLRHTRRNLNGAHGGDESDSNKIIRDVID